ncbi:hypothetical protein [Sodalis sp.]
MLHYEVVQGMGTELGASAVQVVLLSWIIREPERLPEVQSEVYERER